MYTRCPHCTTIFRVTAEQLRTAHGDVACVTCNQSFSALDSLSDDVTTLIGVPAPVGTGTTDTHDDARADAAGELVPDEIEDDGAGDDIARTDDNDREVSSDDAEDVEHLDIEAETARHPLPDQPSDADTDSAPADDDLPLTEPAGSATPTDTGPACEDEPIHDGAADPDAEPGSGIDIAGDERIDSQVDEQLADRLADNGNEAGAAALPDALEFDTEDEPTAPPRAPADSAEDFPLDSLEFDAPEQTWTRFFVSPDGPAATDDSGPAAAMTPEASSARVSPADTTDDADRPATDTASLANQTADPQEWQGFLAEIESDDTTMTEAVDADAVIDAPAEDSSAADDADEAAINDDDEPAREIPIIPPWLDDDGQADDESQQPGRRVSRTALGVGAAALVLLCGQLIHYNRDQLATHPTAGGMVRQFYALFDAPLYPHWSLDQYQITGTEAVTGRTAPEALDILANVVVGGEHPVGMPLVRVVLQDRWSNPVASRVFTPAEYLRDGGGAQSTVTPGTALPIEINVIDPGADALGYVVDICLPRRKAGLECQIARDPFK